MRRAPWSLAHKRTVFCAGQLGVMVVAIDFSANKVAESAADENVRCLNACIPQSRVQLLGDSDAGAREGTRRAEARAGAIVAAGARELRDARLHHRPGGRPILKSGIEYDSGRTMSQAIKIERGGVSRANELPGSRV